MKKTYVLDTNVLIQSPAALMAFEDNDIVLAVNVLESLDALKGADGEQGANARHCIRTLEALRQAGSLTEGVALASGGTLRLETNCVHVPLPEGFPQARNDSRLLKVCLGLGRKQPVILVTKDIVLRIKAQMLGIEAEDYFTEQVSETADQYTGRIHVYVPEARFDAFGAEPLAPEEVYQVDEGGAPVAVDLVTNAFLILHADRSQSKTKLARFDGTYIVPLRHKNKRPYGVTPRNVGQIFMQEALLADADEAPLVIVKGIAGTAKTFYALACGLSAILDGDNPAYRRILISRPNVHFDDDIGFLPGDESDKIAPLLRPAIDNLELLVDQSDAERFRNEGDLAGKIDVLFDRGIISAQALNFIRGRSVSKTYLIIDEAQNLTPKQAKGIITRAGRGTKIILLGDPQQIDNPLLDPRTNGLSYAAEKMKGSPYCYQLTMADDECERSQLARDAAGRM